MNRTYTQIQMQKLQAEMDKLQSIIDQPEQWEPEGGEWYIRNDASIGNSSSTDNCRNFGLERSTKELAERATKEMRAFNRILAYVHEHAPDWVADWSDANQKKCNVYFNHTSKDYWHVDYNVFSNSVQPYMPENVARQLCEDLNSGRVVL
jgi:hypothetical protein